MRRTIRNAGSAAVLQQNGRASFSPHAANLLDYREEGTWADSGHDFFQSYTWHIRGQRTEIFFGSGPQQGRPFLALDFDPQTRTAFDTHNCEPDLYRVRYRLIAKGAFQTLIVVRGPKKAYIAQTEFERIESA